MTTIVYHDKRLWADRCVTDRGTIVVGGKRKIFIVKPSKGDVEEAIIGGAGNFAIIERWAGRWNSGVLFGPKSRDTEKDPTDVLVVYKLIDGSVVVRAYDETGYVTYIDPPLLAIGSGGGYAQAAILAGADVPKALRIAEQMDPHTVLPDGRYDVISI
jgi:hypothetical protein